MEVESEVEKLKSQVNALQNKLVQINGVADAGTDNILAKVQKSTVSALICIVYTAGCIAIGAVLF